MNILVVEDEAIVGMDLESKLTDMGYNVVNVIDNYEEAIKIPESEKVDLALLDINIHGDRSGVDIAKHFRSKFDIPCVFLTAFSSNSIINKAKEVGAYGYVLKPFVKKDLYTVIEIAQSKSLADKEIRAEKDKLELRVEERTKELKVLNEKLREEITYRKQLEDDLRAVELKERKRIAKELHDGLSQRLTAAKYTLGAIRKKADISEDLDDAFKDSIKIIEESMREVRELSHQLIPSHIQDQGLINSIKNTCKRLEYLELFNINLDIGSHIDEMGAYQETVLFRIFQEAINNSIKHANAKNIWVKIDSVDGKIVMIVKDDGVGIEYDAEKGAGIGIQNLNERCQSIGASIEMESEAGKGTSITVKL